MTTESNKLIAEFMGLKPVEHLGRYSISKDHCTCNEDTPEKAMQGFGSIAKYATSWDWLMSVVEKIYQMDIYYTYVSETSGQFKNSIELTTKIDNVYKAVTEFIKWYNENKS